MIYGYISISNYIRCNIDTDYQEEAVSELRKVRLFLNEKERDTSANIEYKNSHFKNDIQKFITKSKQGNLVILDKKEYYNMLKEIKELKEQLNK